MKVKVTLSSRVDKTKLKTTYDMVIKIPSLREKAVAQIAEVKSTVSERVSAK